MKTIELTDEQSDLLLLIDSPDDGSQTHVVVDGERINKELIALGLLSCRGKDSNGRECYDLTDEGEAMYAHLKRSPRVRTVEFPGTHQILFSCDSISFPARVDGKSVECRISYEALMTRFHSRPGDKEFEKTFLAERVAIETLARKMIEAGQIGRERVLRINS